MIINNILEDLEGLKDYFIKPTRNKDADKKLIDSQFFSRMTQLIKTTTELNDRFESGALQTITVHLC